jgi:hypothetical protein
MVPPDLRNASSVIDLFDRAADGLRSSPMRAGSIVQLPTRGRLIATGDLHDNPLHLQKIVALARLDASPDHHVALHELIHGDRLVNSMDFSYRVLARAAHLTLLHPGQVHPLLANHELAQMSGRSISKGAGDSVKMFNDALDFVFGEDAIEVAESIHRFIAAMPLALRSGEPGQPGVLCAHSLPAPGMMNVFDPAVLERDLNAEDYLPRTGSAHLMVWGRGHSHEQIDALAARWNVKLFILGHERVETGIEIKGPRLIVLNSDHDRATVLPVNLGDVPEDAVEVMMHAVPLSAVGEGPLAA